MTSTPGWHIWIDRGGTFTDIVAISPDGSALFVADAGNHKIRRVEVGTGAVTTVAGSGTADSADGVGDAAQFNNPYGIAISPDGGALFVTDSGNHKIRRVEVATGAVTTLAGSGNDGDADGVTDCADNCPSVPSAGLVNSDDGGDACHYDNDSVPDDNPDNCPTGSNPEQTDSNGDGCGAPLCAGN